MLVFCLNEITFRQTVFIIIILVIWAPDNGTKFQG